MIYLYDNAIVDNLVGSFNQDDTQGAVVKVVSPDDVLGLVAQAKEDQINFPVVALIRDPDSGSIDTTRVNFTQMVKGTQAMMDTDTNMIYNERAIPIKLSYSMTVLATNTIDIDEIVRELVFKYTKMYFLTITLPYEVKRQIRFGISIDREKDIERSSGNAEYLQKGSLHQAIIPLKCDGAVMVHYTPAHLRRTQIEYDMVTAKPKVVVEPSAPLNPDGVTKGS